MATRITPPLIRRIRNWTVISASIIMIVYLAVINLDVDSLKLGVYQCDTVTSTASRTSDIEVDHFNIQGHRLFYTTLPIDRSLVHLFLSSERSDKIEIKSKDYNLMKFQIVNFGILPSITCRLFRNDQNNRTQKIKGRVYGISNLVIDCDQCEETNIDGDNNYELKLPSGSTSPYTVSFQDRNNTRKAIQLKLLPANNDDHIHIDLAFDQSNPMTWLEKIRINLRYLLYRIRNILGT